MKDEALKTPIEQKLPTVAAKPGGMNQKPAPGRMLVVGRVLDPSGNPAASVAVDIIGRSRTPELARRCADGSLRGARPRGDRW